MAGGNPSKLVPCTPENARERQLKSAAKRKENNAKKKLMSQIYAEFLEKKYSIKVGNKIKKMSGAELCNEAMKKIIARGDSSSVSLLRELREGTEGTKMQVTGNVTTKLETAEERERLFDELIND
jgi:hypothetical protein